MGVGGRLRERERLVLAEEVDFGGGEAELRVGDGGGELWGHVMRLGGGWGAWWRGLVRRDGRGVRRAGEGDARGIAGWEAVSVEVWLAGWMRVLEKSAR